MKIGELRKIRLRKHKFTNSAGQESNVFFDFYRTTQAASSRNQQSKGTTVEVACSASLR